MEEVGDLGRCEVITSGTIHGVDFAEFPGLPDTRIRQEEVEMDIKSVTLEELRTERPELIAELVGAIPPAQPVPDPAKELRLAVLEAACSGVASVVAAYLTEHVKTVEEIPGAIEDARKAALEHLTRPVQAINLRGDGGPAPVPAAVPDQLTDAQHDMIAAAGGKS
jgi:hypothetical protein